jgi:hypothetical protein
MPKSVQRSFMLGHLLIYTITFQGPPVVPATSKCKKGDKKKRKQLTSSMGELLVIPFLSKFSIPSDEEDTLSKAVQEYVRNKEKTFTSSCYLWKMIMLQEPT